MFTSLKSFNINGIPIQDTKRINIFVGKPDTGKSEIISAISLYASKNNIPVKHCNDLSDNCFLFKTGYLSPFDTFAKILNLSGLKIKGHSIKDAVRECPNSYKIITDDGNEYNLFNIGRGIKTLMGTYIRISENHNKNGSVLCIDNVGSGMHPDTLEALSSIIHEQAVRYDVTLFISTNSKEFIDCFLYDDKRASECALYVLGDYIGNPMDSTQKSSAPNNRAELYEEWLAEQEQWLGDHLFERVVDGVWGSGKYPTAIKIDLRGWDAEASIASVCCEAVVVRERTVKKALASLITSLESRMRELGEGAAAASAVLYLPNLVQQQTSAAESSVSVRRFGGREAAKAISVSDVDFRRI